MLKGFREFITRGNVVDLAVAVVIGAAFTAVVTSFTNNIIHPMINAITGSGTNGIGFYVGAHVPKNRVDISAFITAVINFVLVAAVVYFFVVVPMNAAAARRARKGPPPAEEESELDVLRAIREELRTGRGGNGESASDEAVS